MRKRPLASVETAPPTSPARPRAQSMAPAIPDKDAKLAVGKPRQKHIDTYNSTSTGHQVGGVAKPTSWRRSRTSKLQHQFRSHPPPPALVAAAAPAQPAAAALPPAPASPPDPPAVPPKIFRNCTIYINGTTAPAISDLLLKRHLSAHGAIVAAGLARKSVTHVILAKPSGGGSGAGGGLAAGKLQKELARKGGNAIKYVSVEWYVQPSCFFIDM
ncbi:hypothetical protein DFH27DRAFT_320989 [Peziza echinospora]|nr:hypothetical protein DFH27DRAFT_320989 [Peziza echinospora]